MARTQQVSQNTSLANIKAPSKVDFMHSNETLNASPSISRKEKYDLTSDYFKQKWGEKLLEKIFIWFGRLPLPLSVTEMHK